MSDSSAPSQCPFHAAAGDGRAPVPTAPALRPGLPALTERIAKLPLDERGYPVPFFVAWIEGKPDFRVMDPAKWMACVRDRLCWVCGEPLGRWMVFPIGPMCVVNRTTSEPPSHRECAEWSVRGCPFLSRPGMVRREDELTQANEGNVAGIMLKRNPGVTALWMTRSYTLFKAGGGGRGYLFRIGEPATVTWWREGRPATREEATAAMLSGLPALANVCRDAEELKALQEAAKAAYRWFPAGEENHEDTKDTKSPDGAPSVPLCLGGESPSDPSKRLDEGQSPMADGKGEGAA